MSTMERRNIILPGDGAETHLDVYTYFIFIPIPRAPDFHSERETAVNKHIYIHITDINLRLTSDFSTIVGPSVNE